MKDNEMLSREDLEQVSGGYTTEKRSDYKGVQCSFCGERKVYSIAVYEIKNGGNSSTWGPYQCECCGRKWRGTRVGSGEKTTWRDVVEE